MPDQSMPPEADGQGAWARPVPGRLGEGIVALALLTLALFFVWHAALLPFGEVGLPGPGFFPFALGIVLGLLALAILYGIWRSGVGEVVFLGHRDVLLTLAAMAGAAYAFERVGVYGTLGTLAALLLYFVARSALWRVLVGASLGMVAVWLFFGMALGVRLPVGELWPLLLESSAPPLSDQPSDEPSAKSDHPSGQQ